MAILSIQSHVSYGIAGNSGAVFPLQRLGNEVWPVNTVEFSNHTGYPSWKGDVLRPSLISELTAGIKELGVLKNCDAVLSGYIGAPEAVSHLSAAVGMVKAANPDAMYCFDPVMGDVGAGFYVTEDIQKLFKNRLLPIADIITPNQFEFNYLAGADTSQKNIALAAIKQLHEHCKIILVTSYISNADNDDIAMLASDGKCVYIVHTPILKFSKPTAGGGDITTAIFLSWYLKTREVKFSLEKTATSIYGILKKTYDNNAPEILLINSQDELVNPSYTFTAEVWS